LLYRAGNKLDDRLEIKGIGVGSSRFVGAFYFVAILAVIAGLTGILHLAAPGSSLDVYAHVHFETLLYVLAGAFAAYLLVRGFWDSFWDAGTDDGSIED